MRPIKFRAYDKITKQMCSVWSIHFKAWDLQPETINYVTIETDGTVDRMEHEVVLMQFTGLLDSKGIPIFEGDIIKTERFNNNLFVKWDYDQWGLFDGICNELSIDPAYDEVIGSVHESPELLESK